MVLFYLCLLSSIPMAKGQNEDELKVELIPVSPTIVATAAKVMEGCEPLKGKIIGEINKNGIYTLTGELFHNGKIYAVIDDNDDVILCEWQKPAWTPISALNIHTSWNFPLGYREQDGRDPREQPQPFWMLDLQNRFLLVVASYMEKAGQNYYVMLFDSKCERLLSTDSSFGLRPVVKEKYLLTGDASRVKAEWEATYFSRIENNTFTVKKSWEDSLPWHAEDREDRPDDSSNYASSNGEGYLILPDDSGGKHPADYIILRSDPKERKSYLYPGEMHDKPFAAVYFTQKKALDDHDPLAYIFEKLTCLPEKLYPSYYQPGVEVKAEHHWKIKVNGNDKEIVKLLSPNPVR